MRSSSLCPFLLVPSPERKGEECVDDHLIVFCGDDTGWSVQNTTKSHSTVHGTSFFLSVPLATLLEKRGASGRLHQKLTREMERTYASCTGIPLLLRRASSLSLALSLREQSTGVCDMRR